MRTPGQLSSHYPEHYNFTDSQRTIIEILQKHTGHVIFKMIFTFFKSHRYLLKNIGIKSFPVHTPVQKVAVMHVDCNELNIVCRLIIRMLMEITTCREGIKKKPAHKLNYLPQLGNVSMPVCLFFFLLAR